MDMRPSTGDEQPMRGLTHEKNRLFLPQKLSVVCRSQARDSLSPFHVVWLDFVLVLHRQP